ncbi:hypothetical protein ACRN97_12270 [Shewanella baltica]|uniref:hypothetical protein n=1 Tax=Shewanella baltica TaxID=62322 RepID=UPI003D7B36CB
MGNAASKRAAAARHNARYEQRDAVRPKLTQSPGQKAVKKIDKNVGTIGHVDHGVKPRGRILGFIAAMAGLFSK